jgi:hypothetical protein
MDFQEEGTKVGDVGERAEKRVVEGVEVESINHIYGKDMPDFSGIHLFVFVGVWLADVKHNRQVLTPDNMLTLAGPTCYFCEEEYAEGVDPACPGDNREFEKEDRDVPAAD